MAYPPARHEEAIGGSGLPPLGWSGFGSVRVRTGDRGGTSGNMEALENVLEMLADCSFGEAKLPADIGVASSCRDEPEDFPLTRGQFRYACAAALRVPVHAVQMWAEQGQ